MANPDEVDVAPPATRTLPSASSTAECPNRAVGSVAWASHSASSDTASSEPGPASAAHHGSPSTAHAGNHGAGTAPSRTGHGDRGSKDRPRIAPNPRRQPHPIRPDPGMTDPRSGGPSMDPLMVATFSRQLHAQRHAELTRQ